MFSRSGRLGRMPSCLRSSLSMQMPAATACVRGSECQASAADFDRAGVGLQVAADQPRDLVLSAAQQAGQRDDFAAPGS